MTSATSEGAQGIFSKITFLKSVRSNKKDEVCYSFVVEIFTKSLHRGGVTLSSRKIVKALPVGLMAKLGLQSTLRSQYLVLLSKLSC